MFNVDLFRKLGNVRDEIMYIKAELRLLRDKRADEACEKLEKVREKLFEIMFGKGVWE